MSEQQVGTKGGLSQRWREQADSIDDGGSLTACANAALTIRNRSAELDAAKLRIEEAVKALPHDTRYEFWRDYELIAREAVLKIIREIL